MNQELESFKYLLAEIEKTNKENVKERFSNLFVIGYTLFEFNDRKAVAFFDTSLPTMGRWRRGEVIPAIALPVLKVFGELAKHKIKSLQSS